MPNYAVISGNAVVNIIVADSLEDAEALTNQVCIESEDAEIGLVYDQELGTFSQIEVVDLEPIPLLEEPGATSEEPEALPAE